MTQSLRTIPVRDSVEPEDLAEIQRRLDAEIPKPAVSLPPVRSRTIAVGMAVQFYVAVQKVVTPRAALVTDVYATGHVDLMVVNRLGVMFKHQVPHGSGRPGCWGFIP